jgi:hypothetical protein
MISPEKEQQRPLKIENHKMKQLPGLKIQFLKGTGRTTIYPL